MLQKDTEKRWDAARIFHFTNVNFDEILLLKTQLTVLFKILLTIASVAFDKKL